MNTAKKFQLEPLPWGVRLSFAVLVMTALLMHSYRPQVVNAKTGEAIVAAPRAMFPVAPDREPRKVTQVVATAYNSLAWQTDDTPFITASGTHTRHGVVAANFLPIGTRVRFPEVYGDTVFTVEDRMNQKYNRGRIDIWMLEYRDAKQFGAKRLKMEVF
ncbi:MAG: hypothetical protein AAB579_04130 [Patescibacteria group bacterium]